MSKFYNDTMKGLLEAVEIEKGHIPLTERTDMPAPTFYVADNERELVDKLIEIRKKENISQEELAKLTGNSQQAISRFEQKAHSPSLKLFSNIINALGYEVQFIKKTSRI